MAMTTRRRAAPAETKAAKSRLDEATGIELLHTPDVGSLVNAANMERFARERETELKTMKTGEYAPAALGAVLALQFRATALIEAAFARIEALEADLRKTKSIAHKSLDDLSVEQIDDRRVRFTFGKGDDGASFEVVIPAIIDRGLWSDRANYHRGDAITQNGALWIAQQDNPRGKPGTADSGWRLAVKAGKDAR